METVKTELTQEFVSDCEKLKKIEVGTDEYRNAVDGTTKVADRLIRIAEIEKDAEIKKAQAKSERRDRIAKNVTTVATFIITTAVSIWGITKTFKFDEQETVTSTLGRSFLRDLIPKK